MKTSLLTFVGSLAVSAVGCGHMTIAAVEKVREAVEPPPEPIVNVDMSGVEAKFDALMVKLDAIAEARPDPVAEPGFRRSDIDREPEPVEEPSREPNPAPPAETPFVPVDDTPTKLDQLTAAVDALRQTVADDIASRKAAPAVKADEPKGYTGAVLWSWTGHRCAPCEALKAGLRGAGWTVSDDRNPHFWVQYDDQREAPEVVYYRDGVEIARIKGYGHTLTELSRIANTHPLLAKSVQATPKGEAWDDPEPSPNCAGSAFGVRR